MKTLGKWWNDTSIDVVEIEGKAIALSGWNGEIYTDCFEVSDQQDNKFYESAADKIEVEPIYSDQEDEYGSFEIVDYKFY